jgi:hypothetical protein
MGKNITDGPTAGEPRWVSYEEGQQILAAGREAKRLRDSKPRSAAIEPLHRAPRARPFSTYGGRGWSEWSKQQLKAREAEKEVLRQNSKKARLAKEGDAAPANRLLRRDVRGLLEDGDGTQRSIREIWRVLREERGWHSVDRDRVGKIVKELRGAGRS